MTSTEPNVTDQSVTIPAKNLDMPARLIVPSAAPPAGEVGEAGAEPRPGVVVLHDYWGLDEATLRATTRLAGSGYVVIAPDLFARSGGPKDTSSATALLDFTLSLFDSQII